VILDASAVVELLLGSAKGRQVATLIEDPSYSLDVPHLIDVEVAQALRRYVRSGDLLESDAVMALGLLASLDLSRHSHEPLLERVWELRGNLTAYDAVYVALAEALNATLVTCDGRLAKAPGLRARLHLVR